MALNIILTRKVDVASLSRKEFKVFSSTYSKMWFAEDLQPCSLDLSKSCRGIRYYDSYVKVCEGKPNTRRVHLGLTGDGMCEPYGYPFSYQKSLSKRYRITKIKNFSLKRLQSPEISTKIWGKSTKIWENQPKFGKNRLKCREKSL